MSKHQPTLKHIGEVFQKLPDSTGHLLREISYVLMNSLVEYNYRTLILADQIFEKVGSLSKEVTDSFNTYLKQSLEREFISEDENCQHRLKFIEDLCQREKSSDITEMKELHEAHLNSFSNRYDIGSLSSQVRSILDLCLNGSQSTKPSLDIHHRISFKDGRVYEGQIHKGKKNGRGKLLFPNGQAYEGDWLEGERHGRGEYRWKDGSHYEGDYNHNARHGKGKYTFADRKVYEGPWDRGLRSGRGVLTWENGDRYEGDFLKGQRTGRGVLAW